ncbi:chemotaxis protein CheA [Xylophilus sp. GW821-FHT01B05]
MNLDEALPTFIAESRELLQDMEHALLGVLPAHDSQHAVNAIFRAAHTIKGSAGLFALDDIVAFTHVLESVLDRVRDGALALDEPLVALLLGCSDHIGMQVEALASGTPDPGTADRAVPLLAQLQQHLGAAPAPAPAVSASAASTAVAPVAGDGGEGGADHWHLSLRFGAEVLRNGMDPISFLRYLGRIGRITGVALLPGSVPPLQALDAERCYLGLELGLASEAELATIEGAFEFVRDDCGVRILPPRSPVADYLALIAALGEPPALLAELLVRCGSLPAAALANAMATTAAPAVAAPPQRAPEAKAPESASIRVDADKLDRLINLVGELVTASASAGLVARSLRNVALQECQATLTALVDEVRDSALQLRMVKIGTSFARFRRMVHDVARELGKDISLVLNGEDTELDKTVIEKIGDPLTHLVRNAMDHGIEPAALRLARDKPAQGTVTLNAYHASGHIVIEVRDDGGGLDRERILAKALERGLIEPGRQLSDSETYALVFEPGFSTAEQVTNLSGRGVGMDVVKRNIAALRGSIAIASTPGRGTTVTVRLPLTLALINGFQVGVGRSVFVVPLDMVDECIEFRDDGSRDYLDLRGKVLPFIRLRALFDIGGAPPARQNIVIVRHAGQQVGLVVDTLFGESQTVIKPLSRLFGQARGISGSSIRGNGDVALILDIPALVDGREGSPPPLAQGAPLLV